MTHPTITKELVVQMAREAGTPYVNRHCPGQTSFGFTEESLHVFAKAIYKLGRNAGLDEAKQACMAHGKGDYPAVFADVIESLKDNTP